MLVSYWLNFKNEHKTLLERAGHDKQLGPHEIRLRCWRLIQKHCSILPLPLVFLAVHAKRSPRRTFNLQAIFA